MTVRWTPHGLPKIRDEMVRVHREAAARTDGYAADPRAAALIRRRGDLDADLPAMATSMRQLADQYLAAELYWVTREMTRVALDASGDIPEWTPAAARPTSFGLLVWDGGLPHLPWRGAPDSTWAASPLGARVPPTCRVDAIMWSPDSRGIRIGALTRTDPIADMLTDDWAAGPLFAFVDLVLPLLEPVPTTSSDWSSGLLAAIGATWLLMEQPTVATQRPLHEHPPGTGGARPPQRDRDVTIIDLRHLRTPTAPREHDESGPSREYRHRWMVRGHWRQQAVGPQRSQRRPTWVPPHIKGPDGAPMIETEHVSVWRR